MCDHHWIDWQNDDDGNEVLRCTECCKILAWDCEVCGGQGLVNEAEYECDWVNFSDRMVTCPNCSGEGIVNTDDCPELAWRGD